MIADRIHGRTLPPGRKADGRACRLAAFAMTCVISTVLIAVGAAKAEEEVRDLNYDALARRMVQQMALKPGERVLTIAHPGKLDKLWTFVRYDVVKAGGVDLGVIEIPAVPVASTWDPNVLQNSNKVAGEIYTKWLTDADVIVDAATYGIVARTGNTRPPNLRGAPNIVAMENWVGEAQRQTGKVKSRRTLHFHWWQGGGADSLPGVQAPPTYEAERVLEKAILDVDYAEISAQQKRFEAATRGKLIRVTSPLGTNVTFEVGNRGFTLQDGDLSGEHAMAATVEVDREQELPNGIARVAPIEESVNGTIAYPVTNWAGHQVYGLKITLRNGRIVSAKADSGLEFFRQEIKAGNDTGTHFRDFSLGFNPELAVPNRNPWLPYYGYGAGVVRLGLGNNGELSGAIGGPYTRRDLFVDATVNVGGEIWAKDGKLTPH